MNELLTIREAAKELRCSPNFLYVRVKQLLHIRLSKHAIRFERHVLLEHFKQAATHEETR